MRHFRKKEISYMFLFFLFVGSGFLAGNHYFKRAAIQADTPLVLTSDKQKILPAETVTLTLKSNQKATKEPIMMNIPKGLVVDLEMTKQLNDGHDNQEITLNEEQSKLAVYLNSEADNREIKLCFRAETYGDYSIEATQKVANDLQTTPPLKLQVVPVEPISQKFAPSLIDDVIAPFADSDYQPVQNYPGINLIDPINTVNNPVIPGENGFVMRLSDRLSYEAKGYDLDYRGNYDWSHLPGFIFYDTTANPVKDRYVLVKNAGIYRGKWIDVKLVVDEVIAKSTSGAFSVATTTYDTKDIDFGLGETGTFADYFMSVGAYEGSTKGDSFKYHYEFYEHDSQKRISTMSGMWNYQRLNEEKQAQIPTDSKHMSSLYANNDTTVYYKRDVPTPGTARFWGTADGYESGPDTYLTSLFSKVAEYPITMNLATKEDDYSTGMILMYNRTPLTRIYPGRPEVIGEISNEDPKRLKYHILQEIPAQLPVYYSDSFKLTTTFPTDFDIDLNSIKIMNVLDGTVSTDFKQPTLSADKRTLTIEAMNPKSSSFNDDMYEIYVEGTVNSSFDFANYKGKTGNRVKTYDPATGYLAIPVTAQNEFVINGKTITQDPNLLEEGEEDKAISYVKYKGIPDGDPVMDKKVKINQDFNLLNPSDFVTNLRVDTDSPLDKPVEAVRFENIPDTSKPGTAKVTVVIVTAQGIEKKIIVDVTIANNDPVPVINVSGAIRNDTQNLGFSANQSAHINDELTFQGKVVKTIANSVWLEPTLKMNVPEGVTFPKTGNVTVKDENNTEIELAEPIQYDSNARELTAKLKNTLSTDATIMIQFQTKVEDKALGQTYETKVSVAGKDSNFTPIDVSGTANLTVEDYAEPQVQFAGKVQKESEGSWIDTIQANPNDLVNYTIEATLTNDYTVWSNQKIVVTIPNNLENITVDKAILRRPHQTDIELPLKLMTESGVQKVVFETSEGTNAFTESGSKLILTYTGKISVNVGLNETLVTPVSIEGLNSKGQVIQPITGNINLAVSEGTLQFTTTSSLDFGVQELISISEKRHAPDKNIEMLVEDTRGTNERWKIMATITQEFTNGTSLLNGGLTFVTDTGSVIELSKTASQVYEKNPASNGTSNLIWDRTKGQGLFLQQKAGMNKIGSYQGELQWTLTDAL